MIPGQVRNTIFIWEIEAIKKWKKGWCVWQGWLVRPCIKSLDQYTNAPLTNQPTWLCIYLPLLASSLQTNLPSYLKPYLKVLKDWYVCGRLTCQAMYQVIRLRPLSPASQPVQVHVRPLTKGKTLTNHHYNCVCLSAQSIVHLTAQIQNMYIKMCLWEVQWCVELQHILTMVQPSCNVALHPLNLKTQRRCVSKFKHSVLKKYQHHCNSAMMVVGVIDLSSNPAQSSSASQASALPSC